MANPNTNINDRVILKLDTILLRLQLLDVQVQDMGYVLNQLTGNVGTLLQQETSIMAEIDDMVAEITAVKGLEDSAVALINAMAVKLNAIVQSATDLAALKVQVAAATQTLQTNAQPLADAVTANPQ